MTEKDIERASCRWAVEHGWLCFKFISPSHRSVPDRIFAKNGTIIFIEYKTAKGKLTSGQEREIARLRQAGCTVHICRSLSDTKKVLSDDRLGGADQ